MEETLKTRLNNKLRLYGHTDNRLTPYVGKVVTIHDANDGKL